MDFHREKSRGIEDFQYQKKEQRGTMRCGTEVEADKEMSSDVLKNRKASFGQGLAIFSGRRQCMLKI